MIGNLGGAMSVLMPAAVVSGIVVCFLLVRRGQARSAESRNVLPRYIV